MLQNLLTLNVDFWQSLDCLVWTLEVQGRRFYGNTTTSDEWESLAKHNKPYFADGREIKRALTQIARATILRSLKT